MEEWIKQVFEAPEFGLMALPAGLLFGLITSFACIGCSAPLIAAIIGYAGSREEKQQRDTFLIAGFFMLGSVLGVSAAGWAVGTGVIQIKNASLYAENWKWIRARILQRANDCCEGSPKFPDCWVENYKPHPVTGSKVVLTIAHLNHDPSDCREENLRAMCQRCHFHHDQEQHQENSRRTRRARNAMRDLFPMKEDA